MKQDDLYNIEEENVDVLTSVIAFLAIIVCIVNFIINYINNLTESLFFGVFAMASILVALFFYVKLKKYKLGAYISVIGLSISISAFLYLEGLLCFNFLHYFIVVLAIPFLVKRNKNYVKDNCILFTIVIVIAVISISIAPTNPTYTWLTKKDIYDRMILNAITSLFFVVTFIIAIVYANKIYFVALLEGKNLAEKEKDKRIRALTNLGHELRTQINSINGITQLIIEQKKEQKPNKALIEKYTLLLDKCNSQMLNLVNNILDIHKIESGKFELIEKQDNLDALLNQISEEYNVLANTKGLILETNINPNIANLNLVFDKMRLGQVLRNLLANAIKYTYNGTIRFKATLIEETATKASILFKVEDTGIGISEKNYSKIFESFQQLKNENFDIYGGTGLGLSLTKKILDNMKSTINIYSNLKKGTIFSFKIDFKVSNKKNTTNINFLIDNTNCLKGKHVLIAEDNKVNLLYTNTLLKKYKANTFLAKNGLEAIEALKNNSIINTVLLDIEMPKLNGLQAIKQLKELNPKLIVIAFTASIPNETLLKELYSYGFDDFISKPFKKEELIKTIYSTKTLSSAI